MYRSLTEVRERILDRLLQRDGVGIDQWTEERIAFVAAKVNLFADLIYEEEEFMATSKQYALDETTIVFGSEAGETNWTTEAIANGAGRQSDLKDLGAPGTARSDRFHYRLVMAGWQATPTVGNTLDLHMKTSDGTTPDNDDGLTDAAVSAEDKLKNMDFIDEIVCDEAAANIPAATEGYLFIPQRHVGFAIWNRGGSALKNDVAGVKLYLTPRPLQQQAS